MITYNDLYDALRKEKYAPQLQKLSKNFIEDVVEYFKDKKIFSEKESDMFSDIAIKSKKKLENAVVNFRELMALRRRKILNLAFVASETGISKRDFENLFDFEKELFEEIVKGLERGSKNLNGLMIGNKKKESNYFLVRFLESVEEFLDFESNPVGPFEKGEIANLEKELVNILSKDKRVEVLEED